MFKYYLKNIWKSELLAFFTALATLSALAVDSILATDFQPLRLIPIALITLYILFHLWKTWVFSSQTFSAIPLPYFLCLAQSHEWYISAIKQQEAHIKKEGVAWGEIQNSFRIHRQDWAFFDSSKLSENSSDWIHKTKDISNHFDHLANRIEAQPLFHIFVASPAPVALGVGALFAGRVPFSVHQHAGMVKNPYKKVHSSEEVVTAEDGYHILNRRVSELRSIEVKEGAPLNETTASKTMIVLDFTGHRLPKPYPVEEDANIIRVGMVGEEGHIPLSSQWMLIAQEISTVISGELNKGKAVSVLLGVPSTMAFLIGTILRTSSRVDIYYFNRSLDKYHKVLNLSELD
ncbi:hypothetical protein [Alteromonas australica]|uniref:hypothetical protein n=1 Tax=Alteromonas australica TaxID=589873 RepID=UPI003F66F176